MKIGVLADTHDKFAITQRAIATLKERDVVALFHCGDLLSVPLLELFADFPSYMVFGNNDKQRRRLLEEASKQGIHHLEDGGEVLLGSWRIAMTHGHLKPQVQKLLQARPHVLLLGHSHQTRDEKRNGTWIVNPGALHRARVKTCAVLDLETETAEFISMEGR